LLYCCSDITDSLPFHNLLVLDVPVSSIPLLAIVVLTFRAGPRARA
jgi:hypothetical protein